MGHPGAQGQGPFEGVFYATGAYRQNGYDHIRNSGRKGAYGSLAPIKAWLKTKPFLRPPADHGQDSHAQRYTFDHGTCFRRGRAPYPNQAHHMIPSGVFVDLFDGWKRELLMQCKFNINEGQNIIFLPQFLSDTPCHELPYHSGSHPDYDRLLKKDAAAIKKDLQRSRPSACEDGDPLEDVSDRLRQLENKYWNALRAAGRKLKAVRELTRAEIDAAPERR